MASQEFVVLTSLKYLFSILQDLSSVQLEKGLGKPLKS